METFGLYVAHVVYDDATPTRPASTGRYISDAPVDKGEIVYGKHGRAVVRSCRLDQSVDDTFRRNARVLASITPRA
jgi:hypothetical protein